MWEAVDSREPEPRAGCGPANGRRAGRAAVARLTGVAVIAGCAGGAGPAADVVVLDSAGVRIVVNPSAQASAVPVWTLDPEPLLDLGGDERREAEQFHQVADVQLLADGGVVVASRGTLDVRVFGADGTHRVTFGRAGGGPGEFRQVGRVVVLPGDSLLAQDPAASRLSVYTSAGRFVRDVVLAGVVGGRLVGRLAGGGLVATVMQVPFTDQPLSGLQRLPLAVVRFDAAGVVVDTVVVVPGAERVVNVTLSPGATGADGIRTVEVASPPFAKQSEVAVLGDRIAVATQDAPEIVAFDAAGAKVAIVRTGESLRPVTPQHVAAWIDRVVASAPPPVQAGVRGGLEALPAGATVPPYGALLGGPDGELWVADYDDRLAPAGGWTVYDATGAIRGRIVLPPGLRVFALGGDRVAGVERDALDVERVRVYRVRR